MRAGYLGGLAVRSALCALPLELLSSHAATGHACRTELAAQAEQRAEVFPARLRLTRVMIDLAMEVEPGVLARMPAGG